MWSDGAPGRGASVLATAACALRGTILPVLVLVGHAVCGSVAVVERALGVEEYALVVVGRIVVAIVCDCETQITLW